MTSFIRFILAVFVAIPVIYSQPTLGWPPRGDDDDDREPEYLRRQRIVSTSVADNSEPEYIRRQREFDRWVERSRERDHATRLRREEERRLEAARERESVDRRARWNRDEDESGFDLFVGEKLDLKVPVSMDDPSGQKVQIFARKNMVYIGLDLKFEEPAPEGLEERIAKVNELLSMSMGRFSFRVSVTASKKSKASVKWGRDLKAERGVEGGVWSKPHKDSFTWNPNANHFTWAQQVMRILGVGYIGKGQPEHVVGGLMNPIYDVALSSHYLDRWKHLGQSEVEISVAEAAYLVLSLLTRSPKYEEEAREAIEDGVGGFDISFVPASVALGAFDGEQAIERLSQVFNGENAVGRKSPPTKAQCEAYLRKTGLIR